MSRTYYCEVQYRTPAGSCNTFSTTVSAESIDAATEEAQRQCKKERAVSSIDGGSATEVQP